MSVFVWRGGAQDAIFESSSFWHPPFQFGHVCIDYRVCVCVTEIVCPRCLSVCVCVHVCFWMCVCSWRCGDGIQVLHQALQVGHLLGQLVRLVALGERNRVTARGGGGAGGEGGKHLEGEREVGGQRRGSGGQGEEKRGRRGGRGSVRESLQRTRGGVWLG